MLAPPKASDKEGISWLEAKLTREVPREYSGLIGRAVFFNSSQPQAGYLRSEICLPDVANIMKPLVSGRTFVDLGSGAGVSLHARMIAEKFGAERYVGVDKKIANDRNYESNEGLPTYLIGSDMLEFVSRSEEFDSVFFFLSGLEALNVNPRTLLAYCNAMLEEMHRLCSPGDAIVLGALTSRELLNPTGLGFRQLNTKSFSTIYVKQ